ncbi:MAG: type IV pilus twitching motility protein PilT [Deltaproteobacteria bacterium]|nr:type IV pilus twitching motility protein PilT [Deltaproteobacteria bacterium]
MEGSSFPSPPQPSRKPKPLGGEAEELLIGRLAIHFKLLEKKRVHEAWLRKKEIGSELKLGAFLVEEGLLNREQLVQLEQARVQYLSRKGSLKLDTGETSVPFSRPPTGAREAPRELESVAPAVVDPLAKVRYSPERSLEDLLREAHLAGASDFHLHSGAPLKVRLYGELRDVEAKKITAEQAEELIRGLLSAEQQRILDEDHQIDFSFEIAGVGRFRSNAYRQQKGFDAVFRTIPAEAPGLSELGLPEVLVGFTEFHQGLVLITGPAGCGKSTTMAAMVNQINRNRPEHVITIEDPIEVVHRSKQSIVNQRAVGAHTESFDRALRAALREDPDVIVIGELRDLETISLALTAAETGHLVFGTLHTSNAVRTVNRLLGVYPAEQQAQIRTMLSESLRVVVSQRLLPRADGSGQVAALEILVNSSAVGNLIRENKTFQLHSIMQVGGNRGMCLLDNSLQKLVDDGVISAEVALREAEDPSRFQPQQGDDEE